MTKSRDIADSTKTLDVDGGTIKLDGNYPTGTNNVALGDAALASGSLSGGDNTAIGFQALTTNTSGSVNTAVGGDALRYNTTGGNNASLGVNALKQNTSGSFNTGLGRDALQSNTTASNNNAVGYQALYSNTTGAVQTAMGHAALNSNTTGTENTAFGGAALLDNTTGNYNVAAGRNALANNTTASYNTAVGYQAMYLSNASGNGFNTSVGYASGYNLSTGVSNSLFGYNCGSQLTTGSKNTILGTYNGNQGGLDIRTLSNNIVLSDGDGNPRMWGNSSGSFFVNATSNITGPTVGMVNAKSGANKNVFVASVEQSGYTAYAVSGTTNDLGMWLYNRTTSSNVGSIRINSASTSYLTSSDHRLKENVDYTWDATTRLKQLKPARFNFIVDADNTVDGFLAHEVQAVVPEAVDGTHNEVDDDGNAVMQGIDQSKLVPLLVKTIQELEARITALEA